MIKNKIFICLLAIAVTVLCVYCPILTGFPLALVEVEMMKEGKINDYEVKYGKIIVSVRDKYRDSHIHIISHKGVSREEAMKVQSRKKAELEK